MRIGTGLGVLWGVMGTRLWVKTVYGDDWWTRVMDKVQMSHTVLKGMKINIRVLGIARWGRSPPR